MRTEVYQRFHSMRQVLTALHSVGSAHEAQLRLNHETKLSEFAYQWTWMEKISQDPEVRLLSSLTWKAYLPLSDDPCRVGTCDSEAERNFAWLN